EPSAGAVKRTAWAPNRIVVDASLSRDARLLVNQNWHPGWRASVGTVVSDDGLLAVDLPAREHSVVNAFRPMSAIAGAAVSGVALLALLALVVGERRGVTWFRRRTALRTAAVVLAPPLVLVGFLATWSEPRYPPPP